MKRFIAILVIGLLAFFSCAKEEENGGKDTPVAPADIAVSPEALSAEQGGGTLSLTVTAPSRPKLSTEAAWIKIIDGTYKDYQISFTLTVSAFNDFGSREALLTIQAGSKVKTVTLVQPGWEETNPTSGDIHQDLVTPNATPQARALYGFLLDNYGKKTLSAVTADVAWNTKIAQQVWQQTGKYPAINCYDFIHIGVPENNWINYDDLTPVTDWAEAGGIVSLMWHFNVPLSETTEVKNDGSGMAFYSGQSTFKASNALIDGTWEHVWYKDQLEKVADIILQLQGRGIAAIWRPYHEAAGNYYAKNWKGSAWFWWGDEGPEVYKALWNNLFDFFAAKGIRNLIWVWTAQSFNGDPSGFDSDEPWYPGDDKVDVVARDIYGSTAAGVAQEFSTLQNTYPHQMIALGECGHGEGNAPFPSLANGWDLGAKWSWFMPWGASDGTMVGWDWMKEAMASDYVITREDLPATLPVPGADEAGWEMAVSAARRMGTGWNLGNTLESNSGDIDNMWIEKYTDCSPTAYETAWGQPMTTRALIHMFREAGFRSIRVPVTWYPHMDAADVVDAGWMARVREVVDYVIDEGMYCVLNVHHDTGEASTAWLRADKEVYESVRERYVALWRQIATEFASYDEHLLFESFNEMLDRNGTWNSSTDDAHEAINLYNASFVSTVRATGGNNLHRNLILNTYSAAPQAKTLEAFHLPDDSVSGHLLAEVHSYSPYRFAFDNDHPQYTFDAACEQEIREQMATINKYLVSKGIPCIIGEYGCTGQRAETEMAKQAACYIETALQYNIPCFYWMALSDGKDRSVPQWTKPGLKDAIIQAFNDSKR